MRKANSNNLGFNETLQIIKIYQTNKNVPLKDNICDLFHRNSCLKSPRCILLDVSHSLTRFDTQSPTIKSARLKGDKRKT